MRRFLTVLIMGALLFITVTRLTDSFKSVVSGQ
jgi:hypothetical protein